jgi:multicomponent Na+:H+ antiporter subunit A
VLWTVAVHAFAAVLAPALVRRLGRGAFLVLAAAPAAALGWALAETGHVLGGHPIEQVIEWIPEYDVSLAFRLDPLGLLLLYLAAGIGALVLVYCARYFDSDEPGLGLFASSLTAFAGAMIGLVLADDLVLLFVFWELTTILSFLLIGHYADRPGARRSALRAVTVTTFGGLALLAAVVILGQAAGTYRISAILAGPPHGPAVTTALVLVLIGAFAKSAVFPFSQWLPGAMAAPTPVSAYLHAAAMVKAGIYLIARFAPAYGTEPYWRGLCLVLGGATMLLGGVRALRENDLKRVLAFGTVSQLGFLAAVLGGGYRDEAYAGVAMLLAHALFKAPLFLSVGVIDHCTKTRDLRKLSGLGRSMPTLCVVTCLAAASMAGIPPLLGFGGKESVFEAFWSGSGNGSPGSPADPYVLAVFVLGSALTVGYTCRVVWGAFAAKPGVAPTPVHREGALFLAPAGVLALAGLVLGIGAPLLNELFAEYADTLPGPHHLHLHLAGWSGLGPPLGLSALAWVGGAAIFLLRDPLLRFHRDHTLPEGEDVVTNLLLALERASLQITGSVQRGSLPVYLGTVFLTAVALGIWALADGAPWHLPTPVPWWYSRTQLVVAILSCLAALSVPLLRGRLAAALLTGVSGFAVAILFLVDEAPDLAFTQLAAETVSLIVFVLVLRRLDPDFAGTARTRRRAVHLATAVATGAVLSALTYVAAAGRGFSSVGPGYRSLAEHAKLGNVVSAIIVDFRSWDTLGESSVLAIAAAGVTSLVFARRGAEALARHRAAERAAVEGATGGWLAARPAVLQRSLQLEVVARMTYHTILLVSLYLLFHGEGGLGGGFVGGLLAGLGLTMRYLAGGRYELAAAAPVDAGVLLGVGMALAAGTALLGYAWGDTVLAPGTLVLHLPVTGEVDAHSSLLFDFGVYMLVIGVVLDILRSFGSELDRHIAADRRAEADAAAESGGAR